MVGVVHAGLSELPGHRSRGSGLAQLQSPQAAGEVDRVWPTGLVRRSNKNDTQVPPTYRRTEERARWPDDQYSSAGSGRESPAAKYAVYATYVSPLSAKKWRSRDWYFRRGYGSEVYQRSAILTRQLARDQHGRIQCAASPSLAIDLIYDLSSVRSTTSPAFGFNVSAKKSSSLWLSASAQSGTVTCRIPEFHLSRGLPAVVSGTTMEILMPHA